MFLYFNKCIKCINYFDTFRDSQLITQNLEIIIISHTNLHSKYSEWSFYNVTSLKCYGWKK